MKRKHDDEYKFDDVLEECLELVRKRKATVEECLERYQILRLRSGRLRRLRERLEPLLRTALVLEATPRLEPAPKFKSVARMRLMQKARLPLPVVKRKVRPSRMLMRGVAVSLAFLLILSGVAAASTNSMPDSFLYPLKRAIERVRLVTASTNKSRALAHLSFAEERLEEARKMVRVRKTELAQRTLRDMNQETEEAYRSLQKTSGKDKEALLTKLVSLSERQQTVLKNVIEQAPPEARAALEHALEVSQQGHRQAQEAQSKEREKEEAPGQIKREQNGENSQEQNGNNNKGKR